MKFERMFTKTLSPEDLLWAGIIERQVEYDQMPLPKVVHLLREGGFPQHIVKAYALSRLRGTK